jgi:hypothetical protein
MAIVIGFADSESIASQPFNITLPSKASAYPTVGLVLLDVYHLKELVDGLNIIEHKESGCVLLHSAMKKMFLAKMLLK